MIDKELQRNRHEEAMYMAKVLLADKKHNIRKETMIVKSLFLFLISLVIFVVVVFIYNKI